MHSILITGGCGFVGSSLAISLKRKYPDYIVISMDNLKRKGSELNINRLRENNVQFIHGDIRSKEDFDGLPEVTSILDASAEPSVLAGINSAPDYLLNTNLVGTINCLNFAVKRKANLIFLSTSRVYPIRYLEQVEFEESPTRFEISANQSIKGITKRGISEKFPMEGPRSLYGASKLASELLIEEYNYLYNLKTVVNRCGVITGPWQMGKVDQGVVVLWMARHFWKQPLSYIGYGGEGKQVRDILHVDDLFRLVDFQLHNVDEISGQTFNAGGGPEISVSLSELTGICKDITGNEIPIARVAENRQADVRIYVTDNSRITKQTGWQPQIGPEKILEDIYLWIQKNERALASVLQ
jgi:CDP-paratose 2-epimerase